MSEVIDRLFERLRTGDRPAFTELTLTQPLLGMIAAASVTDRFSKITGLVADDLRKVRAVH